MSRRLRCPRFREFLPAFVGCFACFSRRSRARKKAKGPVDEHRNDKHAVNGKLQVSHEIPPEKASEPDDKDRPHSANDIRTSTKCRRSIEELFLDPTHVELGHGGSGLARGASLVPTPCRGTSKEFNYDFFATSIVRDPHPAGSRCLIQTQTQALVARTLRNEAQQIHHVHECGSRMGLYVEQGAEAASCKGKGSLDESSAMDAADKAFDYYYVESCSEGAADSCGRRSESLVTVFRECRPQSASTDSASSADEEPRLRATAPCPLCGYFHSSAPRASGRDGRRFARHVQAMEKEQRERRQRQRQGERCRTAPEALRGARAFCTDLAYTEYYWRRNMRKHECPGERKDERTLSKPRREEGERTAQRSATPAPVSTNDPGTAATPTSEAAPHVVHDIILHYKVEGGGAEEEDGEEDVRSAAGTAFASSAARRSRERHRADSRRAHHTRPHAAPYSHRGHRTAAGSQPQSPPSPRPTRVHGAVAEMRTAARQMQSGDCTTVARERVPWTTTRSTLRAGNKRRQSRGRRRMP